MNILSRSLLLATFAAAPLAQAQLVKAVPAPQGAGADAAAAAVEEAATLPPMMDSPVNLDPPPPAPMSVAEMAAPGPDALPPMQFYASVVSGPLFDVIKTNPLFARTDKDMAGSPIQLRVTHSLQPTAGGMATGLFSAIVAGSTLGLLPVVTNNSLVLTYEIRVNGKEITRYSFERSFTRAQNIWTVDATDATGGLGQEGLDWAKGTAQQFLTEVVKDEKVQALKREYEAYFGSGA
ncbi:MAG: hypothetical protein RL026_1901 [Pseudomonadota bacterium]